MFFKVVHAKFYRNFTNVSNQLRLGSDTLSQLAFLRERNLQVIQTRQWNPHFSKLLLPIFLFTTSPNYQYFYLRFLQTVNISVYYFSKLSIFRNYIYYFLIFQSTISPNCQYFYLLFLQTVHISIYYFSKLSIFLSTIYPNCQYFNLLFF